MSKTRLIAAAIAFAALAIAAPNARAQTEDACVASNEKYLTLHKAGKFIEARAEAAICAGDACPEIVKNECRKRIQEINAAIPGVVFEVKDANGNIVTTVRVSIDGVPLVDHLDGTAVPVNPGEHHFTFEAPNAPAVVKTFLISEGDKAHRESIVLGAPSATTTTTVGGTTYTSTGNGTNGNGPEEPKTPMLTVPGKSAQGGVYIQAMLGGVNWGYFPSAFFDGPYDWAGFRPDIEFGIHPSGRHDGFVIGLRQAFILTSTGGGTVATHAGATSELRVGFDVPLTIAGHEVSIDPFAVVGIGYVFDGVSLGGGGPSAGISAAGGLDAKFFLAGGFYGFARLFQVGAQCFHDIGQCGVDLVFGVGVGVAIGK